MHKVRQGYAQNGRNSRQEVSGMKLWHRCWRSREREQLAALGMYDDLLSLHRQAVSSTWGMSKDGKHWFDPRRQRELAELTTVRRGQSGPERKALQARLLARWRAK